MENHIQFLGLDFRLVDHFPLGYEIWNINSMLPGYLPLCRMAAYQPFPGGRNIDTNSLCAIKTDGAQTILDAIGYGPKTPKEMEDFIQRNNRAQPGSVNHDAVQKMKKAIPFFKKIYKWD